MRYLEELKAQWAKLHPATKPPPTAPRGYEVIKLPNERVEKIDSKGYVTTGLRPTGRNYLVGRGDRWVSSLTPETPPAVINLPNGLRMWEHPGYIISTVGIDPLTGSLSHCHGGGCQYRAFANASDSRTSYRDVGHQYMRIAEEEGYYEGYPLDTATKHEKLEAMEGFTEVPFGLVESMAEANNYVAEPGRYTLDEALQLGNRGIIYAWTGEDIGTHLVAMRNGKQVVTDPSQLLKPFGDYSEGWVGREVEEGFSEGNWAGLEWMAKHHGSGDIDEYVEAKMKRGENPYLLPLDIDAVYLPDPHFER